MGRLARRLSFQRHDLTNCLASFSPTPSLDHMHRVARALSLIPSIIRAFSTQVPREETMLAAVRSDLQRCWKDCSSWCLFLLEEVAPLVNDPTSTDLAHAVANFVRESVQLCMPLAALPITGLLSLGLWLRRVDQEWVNSLGAVTTCGRPCSITLLAALGCTPNSESEPSFYLAFQSCATPTRVTRRLAQRIDNLRSSIEGQVICPATAADTLQNLTTILGVIMHDTKAKKTLMRAHAYPRLFDLFSRFISTLPFLQRCHLCHSRDAARTLYTLSNDLFQAIYNRPSRLEFLRDAVEGGLVQVLFTPFTGDAVPASEDSKAASIRNASHLLRYAPFRALGFAIVEAMRPHLGPGGQDMRNRISSHSSMGLSMVGSWDVFEGLYCRDWVPLERPVPTDPVASSVCFNLLVCHYKLSSV